MDVVKKIREFLSYWYLRYLLATELYMVEPWEKNLLHTIFLITFALFWYFNCNVIVNRISHFRGYPANMESIS